MTTDWETLGSTDSGDVFTIPNLVRRQHLYGLGRTGTGKSVFDARIALADIARGDGGLVLDPHGDLCEDIIDHCPPEHRHRLVYWNPADRDFPVPMNIFECRPNQDKDTVCSEVLGIFKKLYGEFWGPQLEDLLRSLTLAMLDHQFLEDDRIPEGDPEKYNATLKEAHEFLFDKEFRRSYYRFISNDMVLRYWRDFYDRLGVQRPDELVSREQIKYSSSTTNKLRRLLLNPLLFDITTNRNLRNTIDLREIMDSGKVLLVNLAKGRIGEDNSQLLGSVILSRLVVATLSRADMPRADREKHLFHAIIDEFQSFAGESFKLLLSEARKYGVTLTITHQHREQLDREMLGATLNCGSLLCFRLLGRDAAEVGREFDSTPLQTGFDYERVMEDVPEEGSSPTLYAQKTGARFDYRDERGREYFTRLPLHSQVPVFGSYAERERQIANDLTQLPNFTAMVKLSDGSHWKIRTRGLPEESDERLNRIKQLSTSTHDVYSVPEGFKRPAEKSEYLERLSRQEAEDYEAELDERPGQEPPVR